jgi:hypothetical protein
MPSGMRVRSRVANANTDIGVKARPKPKPCKVFDQKMSASVMLISSAPIQKPEIACRARPIASVARAFQLVIQTTQANDAKLPSPRPTSSKPIVLSG